MFADRFVLVIIDVAFRKRRQQLLVRVFNGSHGVLPTAFRVVGLRNVYIPHAITQVRP